MRQNMIAILAILIGTFFATTKVVAKNKKKDSWIKTFQMGKPMSFTIKPGGSYVLLLKPPSPVRFLGLGVVERTRFASGAISTMGRGSFVIKERVLLSLAFGYSLFSGGKIKEARVGSRSALSLEIQADIPVWSACPSGGRLQLDIISGVGVNFHLGGSFWTSSSNYLLKGKAGPSAFAGLMFSIWIYKLQVALSAGFSADMMLLERSGILLSFGPFFGGLFQLHF